MVTAIKDRIPGSLALRVTRVAGAAEALLEGFPLIRRTMGARTVFTPATCDDPFAVHVEAGKRQAPAITDRCIFFSDYM